MKKTCKRSLALVLSLLMLLSVAPLTWAEGENICSNCKRPDGLIPFEEIPATCFAVGYEAGIKCRFCNTYNEGGKEIPKLAHHYEEVPGVTATHEKDGTLKHYICTNAGCGKLFLLEKVNGSELYKEVTDADLIAYGHTPKEEKARYSFDAENNRIKFDCELGGVEYLVCAEETCGREYAPVKLEPTIQHPTKVVSKKDASCTEDGYEAYNVCKICGKILDDNGHETTITVLPAGHKFGDKVPAVEADCTKTGHPDYWECSACKKVFVLPKDFEVTEATTDEEIKAALEEVKPDYAEDGETVVKTAIEKITVPVQPHTFSATPTTPRDDITCDKGGSLATYTCPVCKKAYIEYDVEKGDKVPNDAFLNVEGLPTYEKDKSGSVYYKYMAKWTDAEVAKRDHVWVQDIGPNSLGYVAPKCNAKGSCLATCAICHKQTTLELDELPHTPKDNYETHRATCERGVYRSNTCSVCGQYYEIDLYDPEDSATDAYAPLGHAYSKTRTKIKESTCTEKGYYGYACEFCGKAEPGKIEYINQLAPHTFGEKVNEVAATCTAEGMKAHYRCTVCNKYFDTAKKEVTQESLVLKKLDHVDKNKDAYCDNCGVIMNGCDHICHKQDVFSKLVWFIARLWYQYLGINQECKCGLPHYEKAKNPLN